MPSRANSSRLTAGRDVLRTQTMHPRIFIFVIAMIVICVAPIMGSDKQTDSRKTLKVDLKTIWRDKDVDAEELDRWAGLEKADSFFVKAQRNIAEHNHDIEKASEYLTGDDFWHSLLMTMSLANANQAVENCRYFYRASKACDHAEVAYYTVLGYVRNVDAIKHQSQLLYEFLSAIQNPLLVIEGEKAHEYLKELTSELETLWPLKEKP